MKTLSSLPTLLRWAVVLVVLGVLSLPFQSSGAEEATVDAEKTIVTGIVIVESLEEMVAKQKTIKEQFMKDVEESPFELKDVDCDVTESGYVTLLQPTFATTLKNPQTQNRVLVFVPGDKEMATFVEKGEVAFVEEVLQDHEEIADNKVPVVRALINGRKIPVIIFVKTRSLEMSM